MHPTTLIIDLPALTDQEAKARLRILRISFTDTYIHQELLDFVFSDKNYDHLPKFCMQMVGVAFALGPTGRSLGLNAAINVYVTEIEVTGMDAQSLLYDDLLIYCTRILTHYLYHPYLFAMVKKIPNFVNRLVVERTLYESAGNPDALLCYLSDKVDYGRTHS